MKIKKVDLITQRRIEAEIASALIRKFASEVGSEKAFEIASETIREAAADSGRQIFTKLGSATLAELAHVVRTIWAQDNVLEIEFLKETADELFFNVRRCGYAEMYKKSGLSDFGYCLSCNRDKAFVEGFNSDIVMKRTRTIMEGAPFCDFRFYQKDRGESENRPRENTFF